MRNRPNDPAYKTPLVSTVEDDPTYKNEPAYKKKKLPELVPDIMKDALAYKTALPNERKDYPSPDITYKTKVANVENHVVMGYRMTPSAADYPAHKTM